MNTLPAPARFCICVDELAKLVQGESRLEDAGVQVGGFASLADARQGDVTFYHDTRYAEALKTTRASVILVPMSWSEEQEGIVFIRVASPSIAFDLVLDRYGWHPAPFRAGIHPTAVVDPSVLMDATKVSIGPHAVVEAEVVLGEGVVIGSGCHVGRGSIIGAGSLLHPRVTVQDASVLGERVTLHSGVVIGADGFGYEFEKGCHRKVKQRGIVQLDADVEIGANSTVDRARYGRTWIGAGTKIDNLVQIGHNVVIGKHCILVASVAIAGSVIIGDYVVIGAQVGIAGHVTIGSQARLGARAGVTKSLAGGKTYLGFPAVTVEKEKRRIASVNRLAKLQEKVRALEARLNGETGSRAETPEG